MSGNLPTNSNVRIDLLDEDQIKEEAKVIIRGIVDDYVQSNLDRSRRLKSVGKARNLEQTFHLIKNAISDYERREHITSNNQITFTMMSPDKLISLPSIVINPLSKMPGQFERGAPKKSGHRELKAHIREILDDPDNHGYKKIITGQWFDHRIEFQCWSRTTKEAYDLANKFETIMTQYSFFYQAEGVSRILYQETKSRLTKQISDNILYAFPVVYFIRTEEITEISEKTLERMIVNIGIGQ